ncbi:MAG: hypothetical protein WCJ30_01375 [Deltaproteobacteria bacterium]
MTRKPRPRTERRLSERDAKKLARDLERLALLERGGRPDHPIEAVSSSQVDVQARDTRCAVCESPVDVLDHTAETIDGVRLRVARLRCRQCGRERSIYFKLLSTQPN